MSTTPRDEPRHRASLWVRRAGVGLAAAVALLLGLAFMLERGLELSFVKRRISALVLAAAGVELDYRTLRVHPLSGAELGELVVRSPPALRRLAPELLRLRRLELSWSPVALLRGPCVHVAELTGLTATLVLDENGKTTLDALPPRPSAAKTTPLSQRAGKLVSALQTVESARLTDVTLVLVRTEHGVIAERDTLRGLAATLSTARRAGGRVRLALGQADAPLALALERAGGNAATVNAGGEARLVLALEATPSDARLLLDVRAVRQDFTQSLPLGPLAHVEAVARFEPRAARSALTLSRVELGDHVANTRAVVELPDAGTPLVRRAAGELDPVGLVALVPRELLPLRLAGGNVRYLLENFALARPAPNTSVTLTAEVAGAELALARGHVEVAQARTNLSARPHDGGWAVDGTLELEGARGAFGGTALNGDRLELELHGVRNQAGAIAGKATLAVAALESDIGAKVTLRQVALELETRELLLDGPEPRGELGARLKVGLGERQSVPRIHVDGVDLHAHASFEHGVPRQIDGELGCARVVVARPRGAVIWDHALRTTVALDGLEGLPRAGGNFSQAAGRARLTLEAGAMHVKLDATKRSDRLTYELVAAADALSDLAPLVSVDLAQRVPWQALAVELRSQGHVERLTGPEPLFDDKSALTLPHSVAFEGVAARAVAFDVHSTGTLQHADVHADVTAAGLVVAGKTFGDEHLAVALFVDRSRPAYRLELASDRAPKGRIAAALTYDRARQLAAYAISGALSGLSPLGPFLAKNETLRGLDLSGLELSLTAHGAVGGVAPGAAGEAPTFAEIERRLGASAAVRLEAKGIRWTAGDRALCVPQASLNLVLQDAGERRGLHSELTVATAELDLGRRRVVVNGWHDQSAASFVGTPPNTAIEFSEQVSLAKVEQNFSSFYPIGNLHGQIVARREADGRIELTKLELQNETGGTSLSAHGTLDFSADQRRILLDTQLVQDLARVSTRAERFSGSGRATVAVVLSSADLRLLRTEAKLGLEGARLAWPGRNVELAGVDGEIPLVGDFALEDNGVELVARVAPNPYATLRFADQHPLFHDSSFLSIASVKTPLVSLAPFAANLSVKDNVIALSQVEMGVRGGSVTGDGVLVLNGARSTLQADLRASGVQSSHGEPFDGNAALEFGLADRSIEGRADIVRIGRRHLLDLLDFEDPHRSNAQVNRIRGALELGYPESVALAFKHGFASASVKLGGLASVVNIGEVRGIPVGPLMERALSSLALEEEP